METQKHTQNPRIGVGVIVIHDGKVLLGKRKGSHGAGEWSFPGGHLEFGETVESCAFRELSEETGLKALSAHMGPWVNDIFEEKHYVTLFVFVDKFEGDLELLEPHKCERWEWFEGNAIPNPLFTPIHSLIKTFKIEDLASTSWCQNNQMT